VQCSAVKLGEVQMGRSEVSTSVVKRSEGLRNTASIVIRIQVIYIDIMWFAAHLSVSFYHMLFIFIRFYFVSLYMCL
jgi:hypothetical protein